jgi:hypothetical protein
MTIQIYQLIQWHQVLYSVECVNWSLFIQLLLGSLRVIVVTTLQLK